MDETTKQMISDIERCFGWRKRQRLAYSMIHLSDFQLDDIAYHFDISIAKAEDLLNKAERRMWLWYNLPEEDIIYHGRETHED